jgi:hypothetical protein
LHTGIILARVLLTFAFVIASLAYASVGCLILPPEDIQKAGGNDAPSLDENRTLPQAGFIRVERNLQEWEILGRVIAPDDQRLGARLFLDANYSAPVDIFTNIDSVPAAGTTERVFIVRTIGSGLCALFATPGNNHLVELVVANGPFKNPTGKAVEDGVGVDQLSWAVECFDPPTGDAGP